MYVKIPFAIDFKVYLFNLTNPEEFAQGGKANLQEIGPFFFEEWKEKYDLVDDDPEDTLKYHFKNTYTFRPDLSGPGITGNEIITMPHPLISAILLAVNVDKRPMLGMIAEAIDLLFDNPSDMFWTGRAMDVLFDGIIIDCGKSDGFQVQMICSTFEGGDVKTVQRLNETHFSFSFLQAQNATDLGELTVFRGKKNSGDLGRVAAVNGEAELDVWKGEECNEPKGTDSTIFPPFMNPTDGVWAFELAICRTMLAHYVGKSEYMGIETEEFAVDLTSPDNAKECFCRANGKFPKKGTFDLFACLGAPMIASQPHFYGADPTLLNNFAAGIHPTKENHAIYSHFEPTTGTPVKGARRLQFNLEMVPLKKVPYMANIRPIYYPLFWMDEGLKLDETLANRIKYSVVLANQAQYVLKWLGLIIGGAGTILFAALCLIQMRFAPKKNTANTSGLKIDIQSVEK